MDLDDVLSDKEPPAPEPPEPKEPTGSEPEQNGDPIERAQSRRAEHREKEYAAQGRGPDGRFLPKETEPEPARTEGAAPAVAATPTPVAPPQPAPAPPAPPELTDKERAFLRAAHKERTKRQALEAEIARLKAAPTGEPVDPNAAFWQDPTSALAKHKQEIESVAVSTRLSTTEALARTRYTDFDTNIQAFAEVLQQTPGLQQQWLAQVDPSEFAYQTGKRHLQIKQYGSLDQWQKQTEADVRAKVKAELEAEYKAREEAAAKARAELPGSLAGVSGTRQQAVTWNGPTPLADVLAGK